MEYQIQSSSVEETIETGRRLGSQLRGGEIIALVGHLGSGKTHFVKGVAAGAGSPDAGRVSSPTFVIVNEYHGRLDIYHIDAYRIDTAQQWASIGFEDYCNPDSVVLVEWADRVADYMGGAASIEIRMQAVSETQRHITISGEADYIKL